MASVELRHVWKEYGPHGRGVVAVRNVSLTIGDGEFVCLLGPSGCGKTSVLRMIAGLETITAGEILIGGRVVNALEPADRNVAMAFETYALYPNLTVFDNIGFCLKARRLSPSAVRKAVMGIAERLMLTDILPKRPSELSGGQQQLVSLARALVRDPAVFLLDEPLSHLDARTRVEMRSRIKELAQSLHSTIVYVTHDQEEALALADRIVVMNAGEIQQIGSSLELFQDPRNQFVAGFIGQPPVNFVTGALRETDGAVVFQFNGSQLPVAQCAAKALTGLKRRQVTIGVRPQYIEPVPPERAALHGQLKFLDFLGEETYAVVEVGGSEWIVKVPSWFHAEPGGKVGLSIDQSRIFVFDAHSGEAIS